MVFLTRTRGGFCKAAEHVKRVDGHDRCRGAHRWYTGHVTAGGSICIAVLTLSGSVNSWTPEYSVDSILNVVIANMCADKGLVRVRG